MGSTLEHTKQTRLILSCILIEYPLTFSASLGTGLSQLLVRSRLVDAPLGLIMSLHSKIHSLTYAYSFLLTRVSDKRKSLDPAVTDRVCAPA